MLKIPYFFEKIWKNSPSSGGSASRSQLASGGCMEALPPDPPLSCGFTHTYCTAAKPFNFIALSNEGFKKKILVKIFFLENTLYIWKYFVLNIRADSPRPNLFCSPTAVIQPLPLANFFFFLKKIG